MNFFECRETETGLCFDPCFWQLQNQEEQTDCSYYTGSPDDIDNAKLIEQDC